jgi:poly(A) polymerase
MRAVRYSTRFNFPIESETLQAILSHAESLLPAVAHERIWQEFQKMSQYEHFDTGLVILHQLKLLQTIFPSLSSLSVEEVQNRVSCIEHYPKGAPTIAQLLELFPESNIEEQLQLCEYLKLSNEDKDLTKYLYQLRKHIQAEENRARVIEPVQWAHLYAHKHSELCVKIIASKLPLERREAFTDHHFKKKQLLEQAILRIRSLSPIVRSVDLVNLGIKPGKKMGLLLKEAERISVNENIECRAEILEKLKKSPLWES